MAKTDDRRFHFFTFQTPQTTLVIFLQELWSTLSSSFILILNNLAVLLVRAIDNWGPSFAMWSKNPSLESGSVVVYLPIRLPFLLPWDCCCCPWQTCPAWYLTKESICHSQNRRKKSLFCNFVINFALRLFLFVHKYAVPGIYKIDCLSLAKLFENIFF